MAVLEELTTAVHGIAEKVGPAVVGLGRGFGRGGSGVVVADGRVVTNAHNLRSDEVVVTFADGRAEDGEVAGTDPDGDLAVISVDTGGVTPVELGDAARGRAILRPSCLHPGLAPWRAAPAADLTLR